MYLDYHVQVEEKARKVIISNEPKVTIYRNGNSEQKVEVLLQQQTTFNEISKILERKFEKTFNKLRLFNQQGVEIMKDDLEFVKNGSTLYASRGEEFDANSTFAEYDLVQDLGEGGFGKVVLGIHRKTGQKYAIKIIKTHMIGNAQDIDMVFRESEVLKSLNHKNIVKIYNCFTLSNMQVVFIMEYLEGGELLSLVEEKGHFTEQEARNFFQQLVSAIAYCHTRKVIHRDLKLENLLLTNSQKAEIKAIDFGIAGMASKLNVDNADVGSIRYMAPEVLSGANKSITPLVDVWAMGVILYGMLFGTLPFTGTTGAEVVQQIQDGMYEIPKEFKNKISQPCKDVLYKTLQVDPEKRISAVDLQYHPWVMGVTEKIEHGILNQQPIIKEEEKEARSVSFAAPNPNLPIATKQVPKSIKNLPASFHYSTRSVHEKGVQSQSNVSSSVVQKPTSAKPIAQVAPKKTSQFGNIVKGPKK